MRSAGDLNHGEGLYFMFRMLFGAERADPGPADPGPADPGLSVH